VDDGIHEPIITQGEADWQAAVSLSLQRRNMRYGLPSWSPCDRWRNQMLTSHHCCSCRKDRRFLD